MSTMFKNHRKSLILKDCEWLSNWRSSILMEEKLMENPKLKYSNETFFGDFQTMCQC